jgi:hypothetical protein
MDPMELIDRYIAEVGKDLPRKNRLDIEAEILSALEDMLRERSQKTGRPVDEEMVVEILKEYGAPRKVAASYHSESYVIEPHMLRSFMTVLQVVLPILAVVSLVRMGIALGQVALTFEKVFEAVFLGIADFLGTAFAALGSILVLFVIVQRFLPEFRAKDEHWDPRNLPYATTRNRVEIGSTVLEIFGSILALVLFNFFPQVISIGYNARGIWTVGFLAIATGKAMITTILSDAFFQYLPILTGLWALTILFDAALLRRGRWETWSRWISFGLKVMIITLAGIMVSGPALLVVDANSLLADGFPDPFAAKLLVNLIEQGTIVLLIGIMLGNAVTTLRLLIRLTGRNLTPRLEKFAHP